MTAPASFLIVGATGIGGAIARRLVAQGSKVHIAGRREESLRGLADELGPAATWSMCDVMETGAVKNLAKEVVASNNGVLQGVAYAVGDIPLKSMKATKQEEFMKTYQLHCWGALELVQAALPGLQKAPVPGSVVLFSSLAVSQGFPMHSIIASAKGGVEGLTLSLAAELAPKVRVNCIRPGLSDTSIASKLLRNEDIKQKMGGVNPMPRLGTADDSGAMAAFLLGKDSSWMTGQIIGVDGGRSMLRHKSQ
mmetsp:Transcript_49369/g.89325  ORF Transcript_49369/g.89325 Transcript_49369/m.89325 type:complete len:251 (-) Transcript_49369:82-834(-)